MYLTKLQGEYLSLKTQKTKPEMNLFHSFHKLKQFRAALNMYEVVMFQRRVHQHYIDWLQHGSVALHALKWSHYACLMYPRGGLNKSCRSESESSSIHDIYIYTHTHTHIYIYIRIMLRVFRYSFRLLCIFLSLKLHLYFFYSCLFHMYV